MESDVYKTKKCDLRYIRKDFTHTKHKGIKNKVIYKEIPNIDIDYHKIEDAVQRVNKLTDLAYKFLRSFLLYQYEKNEPLTVLNEGIIKLAFRIFMIPTKIGRAVSTNNKDYQKFINFYNNHFKYLISNFTPIDGTNLSIIIQYKTIEMLTAIETNIKDHFFKYFNRFVDTLLLKNSDKKKLKRLKTCLINKSDDYDQEFNEWVLEYKHKIFPECNTSYSFDLQNKPQNYLKHMIFMNRTIEDNNGKLYQFFSLKSSLVPGYITIDTTILIDLLTKNGHNSRPNEGKTKAQLRKDSSTNKDEAWDLYFDLESDFFKCKGYKFDHLIKTDGRSVSAQFIRGNLYFKNEKLKVLRVKCRFGDENDKKNYSESKKKIHPKITKKEKQKKRKEEFKCVDDMSKEELEQLKSKHIVVVDPGKNTLFYMSDLHNHVLRYTNKQRLFETKRIKYQKKIEKFKRTDKINGKSIIELESDLSEFKSRSCYLKNFCDYVRKKQEISDLVYNHYSSPLYRKLKWYSYINTQRSEERLFEKIRKYYGQFSGGKEIVIVMGNWSAIRQLRNFISTPNLTLKRELAKRFTAYDVDEFRTSKLNYKTRTQCNNLYIKSSGENKNSVRRKIHSVLTYKVDGKRVCINRDRNAILNMKNIVESYMNGKGRPFIFRRGTKIPRTCLCYRPKSKKLLSHQVSAVKQGVLREAVFSATSVTKAINHTGLGVVTKSAEVTDTPR